MKRVPGTIVSGVGLLCLLLAVSQGLRAQTVSVVPKLDLDRLTGAWYEVARYPNKREKHCVDQPMVLIAGGNKLNQLQLVNTCKTKNGDTDVRNGKGKQQDKSGDGKLKVSYLWPLWLFSTKYWVLALGPDYAWALVGSPNHKSLWVLSRTTSMRPEVLAEIEAKATAEGFDTAKLAVTH